MSVKKSPVFQTFDSTDNNDDLPAFAHNIPDITQKDPHITNIRKFHSTDDNNDLPAFARPILDLTQKETFTLTKGPHITIVRQY